MSTFAHLLRKELALQLLDRRFHVVVCIILALSALGTTMGIGTYRSQLREHDNAVAYKRSLRSRWIDSNNLSVLAVRGYAWSRPPEPLSPLVFGQSGALGREVAIRFDYSSSFLVRPQFEASLYEQNPAMKLFGILDTEFIVTYVLSLAVLLFTFDTVCGEKESGTLRLLSSFPVLRVQFALAKLAASCASIVSVFTLGFLVSCSLLAYSGHVSLTNQDWVRVGVLFLAFSLYLVVYGAAGVWISSQTTSRSVAFIGILILWVVSLHLIPDWSVRLAKMVSPTTSTYALDEAELGLRKNSKRDAGTRIGNYIVAKTPNWDQLNDVDRGSLWWASRNDQEVVQMRFAALGDYYDALINNWRARQNEVRRQGQMARLLSAISPFAAIRRIGSAVSRTDADAQARLESELGRYREYFVRYVADKAPRQENRTLSDLAEFTYEDSEGIARCLQRIVPEILNLIVLAALALACSFFAIVRYDVR